jgi:hypothetical protein
MGRQVAIILDEHDEVGLLEFLRSAGPIRIFESFADSIDGLEIHALPARAAGHLFFDVWPSRFAWSPEFAQTRVSPIRWYISNKSTAPILEYSRPPLAGGAGRLYWGDRFSGEPAYDRVAFGGWVDSIWRWVGRTATKSSIAGGVWVFPQAGQSLGDTG